MEKDYAALQGTSLGGMRGSSPPTPIVPENSLQNAINSFDMDLKLLRENLHRANKIKEVLCGEAPEVCREDADMPRGYPGKVGDFIRQHEALRSMILEMQDVLSRVESAL